VSRSPYGYRVWPTGKNFACHAWSPSEWFRAYGFATAREAQWWGLGAIEELGRNDAALASTSAAPKPRSPKDSLGAGAVPGSGDETT
jgi:hypothetical protein